MDSPGNVSRILDAVRRLVGERGVDATRLIDVARAAGVPLGLLRYHYRSLDHLLIEAQRATFRQIHERFEERFAAGDAGVGTALEALDALWASIYDLRAWTPFMVQAAARAARDPDLGARRADFDAENLARVELGLMRAFADDVHRLLLPPDALARAVRAGIYGLVVELAGARTDTEAAEVDATYRAVRDALARVVLLPRPPPRPTAPPVH